MGANSFPYTAVTANVAYQVTPSDTAELPGRIVQLVIGTTGKIKVDTKHAKGFVYSANQVVKLGEVINAEIKRVYSTGTDASDIMAHGIFPQPGALDAPHIPNLAILQDNPDPAIDGDKILLEQFGNSRYLLQE